MERLIRIGLVFLVLSLALNIALLTRVNKIEDMMNGRLMADNELRNLTALTQQNSNRINQAVNIIETAQRWITPVEISDVKQEGNNYKVKLSWVIKDYPGNAPVTFNYRQPGNQVFTSRQAAPVGDGRFEIEISDTLKVEPEWTIQTTYIGRSDGDSKPIQVNETAKAIEGQEPMEYYISVKDGTRLKSSEISSLDLGKLSWGMYAPLSTDVQADRERERYSVILTQFGIEPKQVKLTGATLQAFRGNQVISQNELTEGGGKPGAGVRMFNTEWNYKNLSFDRVLLTVNYANGQQFKKEIAHVQ